MARLRTVGFDVLYVAEMEPGISDETVLARARENEAVPVTCDEGFGELMYRQGRAAAGVVLLRLHGEVK